MSSSSVSRQVDSCEYQIAFRQNLRRKRPAAKYANCIAELYFLSLVKAQRRILVLTTPDWHAMFIRYIRDRLAVGLEIELIELPRELQAEVDRVKELASGEVSLPAESDARERESARPTRGRQVVEATGAGVREEIIEAARHFHSLGHADFTPGENGAVSATAREPLRRIHHTHAYRFRHVQQRTAKSYDSLRGP